MRRLPLAMVTASLSAGAAGAQPPTPQAIFCAELRRVVEVAELDGDFTYLERSRAARPRLGFRWCGATGDAAKGYWLCHEQLAPESLGVASLGARISACLPEAARTGGRREALFTLPSAQIRISESGGPGAHVGLVVQLVVEKR